MANFTFGGLQDLVVHRQLTVDDRWIPNSAASVTDLAGNTDANAATEMAAVGSTDGFFQQENVPVMIFFTGKSAATVALQVYVPNFTGGAAWKTIIPSADWTDGQAKVFLAPTCPWRVGVITLGGDTLYVTAIFMRADYNRHA